ncbi:MAG: bacillithiol biosynthesis cysteine-adding enzyme BshC, partial [Bergeyella zoohelcum]|nr:bacillithiol biosynthesis cysteine-adding enzyme BshC [Bergeyella zoohelcum]
MENRAYIPFQEIDNIPQLIKDFLDKKIEGFQEQSFSLENFQTLMKCKKDSFSMENRETLHSVLVRQLGNLQLSDKQKENLDLMQKTNTFTITTGHQLNLFTGPVFFVYKILQTIKTAHFLKEKFPESNFVPIFWLATEDHDFEEINHFKTTQNYYEMNAKKGGAVGRIEIEDTFFTHQFERDFIDSVYGTELVRWIKEAYQEGHNLATATKILVNRLFSDYGLLMIDGDDETLKTAMKPIFRDELLNQKFYAETKNKVSFLQEKYGKVQVNPREVNLFYLSETRDRIERNGEDFSLVDRKQVFTQSEILEELENYPQKFSPNALMRPVYQEKVLPNLAYIGGNAEIMYWLELKDYFAYLDLGFPVLIPRNSMLYITEKTFGKVKKLNLEINDFFKNFAEVVKRNLLENNSLSSLINEKENQLLEMFSELKNQSEKTEQSFRNLVEAEETRQRKSFEKMRKRLLRAEKIKQNEKLERLETLFLEIHPAKNWQERVLNFSVFYSDFGRDWLRN